MELPEISSDAPLKESLEFSKVNVLGIRSGSDKVDTLNKVCEATIDLRNFDSDQSNLLGTPDTQTGPITAILYAGKGKDGSGLSLTYAAARNGHGKSACEARMILLKQALIGEFVFEDEVRAIADEDRVAWIEETLDYPSVRSILDADDFQIDLMAVIDRHV
jgi:hypothetical protein